VSGAIALLLVVAHPLWADSPEERAQKIAEEYRKAAQAEAEKARQEAIRAVADAQRERLILLGEAQALEKQRRERAANEREDVKQQIETQRKHLEHLQHIRGWALRRFATNTDAKTSDIPQGNGTRRLERWKNARELARRQFIDFPERSHGAIKTGRALNFFLDACGQAALDQALFRQQANDELKTLQLDLQSLAQSTLNDAERAQKTQQIQDKIKINRERLDLLAELDGHMQLNPEHHGRIRCTQGLTGPKLIKLLDDEPMPLNWPAVLREKPIFKPYVEGIAAGRDQALRELESAKPVSAATMNRLMELIDGLDTTFHEDHEQFLDTIRFGISPGADRVQQYVIAKKFVTGLRHGLPQLFEAQQASDIRPGKFEGKTVSQLLAFMSRHGLRFTEADPNGETAYAQLFHMMTNYYTDMYGLQLAAENDRKQLTLLEAREGELRKVIYHENPTLNYVNVPGFLILESRFFNAN